MACWVFSPFFPRIPGGGVFGFNRHAPLVKETPAPPPKPKRKRRSPSEIPPEERVGGKLGNRKSLVKVPLEPPDIHSPNPVTPPAPDFREQREEDKSAARAQFLTELIQKADPQAVQEAVEEFGEERLREIKQRARVRKRGIRFTGDLLRPEEDDEE